MLDLVEFRFAPIAERLPVGVRGRFFQSTDDGTLSYDDGFNWQELAGPDYAILIAQEFIPAYSFVTRDGRLATGDDPTQILGFTLTGATPTLPVKVFLNGRFSNPDWEWTSGQPLYLAGTQIKASGTVQIGTAVGRQTLLVHPAATATSSATDLDRIGVLGGEVAVLGDGVAYYN